MDRGAVADAFDEIAALLDLLGENPFKGRAYASAARTLRGLDRDLGDLVASGEIRKLKGIGDALAQKISTLVAKGDLPYLEELRARVPRGLLEWLGIPGLGPQKARVIHERLGISTLGELEYLCRQGRLRALDGFGEATERKILEGIERLRRDSGLHLQPLVRGEAARLLAILRRTEGVLRAEVGGSVRRCVETSRNVDLVAAADRPEPALAAFASARGVAEVIDRGPDRCSVRLESGPQANLRVVPPRSFPFALAHATGSREHNAALRARANRLGLDLDESRMTRRTDGSEVECADEEAIFRELGLPWIPPELREGEGEIEAAESGRLPRLVEAGDLRGVLHCHSVWSDGLATVAEMAEGARALGMSYLGLCDHSRAAAYAGGLSPERFREQWKEIEGLNASYGGSFRILRGVEVDILPDGSLDFPDDCLEKFELVVASVHSRFGLDREAQTERLVRAARHAPVDMMGHPTGRLLLARDPYPLDLPRVLDAAAERGVAVEINAHPQRLNLDARALRYGLARGMRTSVNPDSHSVAGLRDVEYGLGTARRGGCRAEDILNAWPLDRLLDHLAARRRGARGVLGRRA